MFDIRKIAIGLTADMPVRDVDGEIVTDDKGKELSITYFSPGSKEHAKAKAQIQEEVVKELEAEKEAEKAAKGKSKSKVEKASEDETPVANRRTAKFLAQITKSLNGFDYPGGAEAMYLDPTLGHIVEDADKFVMKRGNFKPNSAPGSSNSSDTQPG